MNTDRRTVIRVFVFVVIAMLAMSLPDALGMPLWVGLVLGVVVGLFAFFALGLGAKSGSRSN